MCHFHELPHIIVHQHSIHNMGQLIAPIIERAGWQKELSVLGVSDMQSMPFSGGMPPKILKNNSLRSILVHIFNLHSTYYNIPQLLHIVHHGQL